MKIYNESITLQTTKSRGSRQHHMTQVKAAMEKSKLRDGIIVVSSLHPNSAIVVNEDEFGLREDVDEWLHDIAPNRERISSASGAVVESNAAVHFQSLLLGHQIIAAILRRPGS